LSKSRFRLGRTKRRHRKVSLGRRCKLRIHLNLDHPVIAKAAELGVVVAAYSPLGRGFLTGKFKVEELEKGDIRTHVPRFRDQEASIIADCQ
jgi:aryl-alcohol dehydrogenase-like predicted oxidoreductase